MSRVFRAIVILVLVAVAVPILPARAAPEPAFGACAADGRQPGGAVYRICMPVASRWNGSLVVYAHGYIAFNKPVAIPEDQLVLPDGTSVPEIVNGLGFAFATTSYRTNGLAVAGAVQDVLEVVDIFTQIHGAPNKTYIVGPSEGGLVTTLAVERFPQVFDGGLALCGPIGDFRKQINYVGDFRVIFDYFFPGVIPGSPVSIPPQVIDQWSPVYIPAVLSALAANPRATQQLLRVTGAPTDSGSWDSVGKTSVGLLWYNTLGTNDALQKLGGQPFDNWRRLYWGADDPFRLNLKVRRFKADGAALRAIENIYQTSGRLSVPLVTLHTTGDPIVPYWHAPLYRLKAISSGSFLRYANIPVFRYGHCNFKPWEVLAGFALLYIKVNAQELSGVEAVLPDAGARDAFYQFARQNGALR